MDNIQERDLGELILKSLTGNASDRQIEQLGEIVSNDPQAMHYYTEYISLYACLACSGSSSNPSQDEEGPEISMDSNVSLRGIDITKDVLSDKKEDTVAGSEVSMDNNIMQAMRELAELEATAPTVYIEKPVEEAPEFKFHKVRKVVSRRRQVSKFSVFAAIASSAALFLILLVSWLTPVSPSSVAILAESVDAVWGDPEFKPEPWSDLPLTTMSLLKGFAKITLYGGADIFIEGPVEVKLESSGQIFLTRGKLFAVVHDGAEKLVVRTPDATIVDYGTEFGVKIGQSGTTEAHVVKGEVELRAGSDAVRHGGIKRLKARQAAAVNSAGEFIKLESDTYQFMQRIPSKYELAMRASKPVAYWKFDVSDETGMQNVLSAGYKPCEFHGNVEVVPGPSLGSGRGSSAVQLDGVNSYLYAPKTGNRNKDGKNNKRNFSYSFWVRPDVIRSQDLITITNKGTVQYRHIGLDDKGRFSFFTYYFNKQKKTSEFFGNTILQVDRWHHVVVTGKQLKGMKAEMRLYVNGREDALIIVGSTYSPQFSGHFYIGFVPEDGKVEGVHSFDGAIAEIAEYDRVLTHKEVENIYSSVKK